MKHGFYWEDLISITKKGMDGSKEIAGMMKGYRNNPPTVIAGSPVVELYDYQEQVKKNMKTGAIDKTGLPKSNVLQFITEDGSKISARPSGTEPKIKFYFSVHMPLKNAGEFESGDQKLKERIQAIISSMNLK